MIRNTFLSLATLLLVGCGSGNTDRDESVKISTEPAHEGVVKVERSDWERVNKPHESSLGVLSKSIDKGLLELYIRKSFRVGRHIQFFIDSDYNEGTGYKSDMVDGADYLIEDGRVYKSTQNGIGWNWKQTTNTYFTNRYYYVYTKADKNTIPNVKSNFRVAAFSLNDKWQVVSNIAMQPINRGVVVIDASVSDWKDTPVLAKSEIGELKVVDDSDNLYLLVDKGNTGKHIQVFINSDNNKNTGYVNDRLNSESGADYYIEDNRLYKSTANGKKWSWKKVGLVSYSKDNNTIEMSISKDKIGLTNSDSVSLGLVAWDAKYENAISKLNMQQKSLKNDKSIVINELMASNAHTLIDPDFSKFSDWIEIHNKTANSIDIGNYKLSDKLGEQKWTIPEGTTIPANSYKLFWADGEDVVKKGYHTNFTLKSKGEDIALYDVENKLVDGFSFGAQKADISVSSSNANAVYMNPTPKKANEQSIGTLELSAKPLFVHDTAFFDTSGTIAITAQNADRIYYTTDGSFPTKNSSVYNGSIDITKNTTIRARAEEDGKLLSVVSTQSYFVNVSSDLPIISLSTDDNYLFDNQIGIYTEGTNGAKTYGCSQGPKIANFFQKWKRPANIEYYATDKTLQFSQEFDIKISGSCSRVMDQKSFSVKADKKYGKDVLEYKLFPNKDINKIKGFKLRNGGQDWYSGLLRDAFLQQVVKDKMSLDYQDYQPVVVYINGKYWGIHNIREKKNEDYLAENHPSVVAKKVDILQDNMGPKEGTNKNYKEMIEFIKNNNLSDDSNYGKVSEMMDIDNYIDYMIAETYFANDDWGYTNVRYWREAKNSPKWRWILEDLDISMGQWNNQISTNMFDFITGVNPGAKNPPWSTFLFTSLLENNGFKNKFKQKYKKYLTNIFTATSMNAILNSLTSKIASEIPNHTNRWKDYTYYSPVGGSKGSWDAKIEHLKDVINSRNKTVSDQLENF